MQAREARRSLTADINVTMCPCIQFCGFKLSFNAWVVVEQVARGCDLGDAVMKALLGGGLASKHAASRTLVSFYTKAW
jgi:hypothetical protein